MAIIDVTVWPNNSTYLHSCIAMFNTVLSLSNRNVGLVLMPIPHAQTCQTALLKHQRLLEDQMVKAGLDVTRRITLLLDKQSGGESDKRKISQPCLMVSTATGQAEPDNEWFQSNAWIQQCIGPLQVIKVSEMVGYDPDSPPGPSARIAQNYACFSV